MEANNSSPKLWQSCDAQEEQKTPKKSPNVDRVLFPKLDTDLDENLDFLMDDPVDSFDLSLADLQAIDEGFREGI